MSLPVVFDKEKLHDFCKLNKLQPFREKQVLHEVFKNQNVDRQNMSTLSNDLRKKLSESFDVISLEHIQTLEDKETTKFAFRTHDGGVVETVLMYHWSKKDNKTNWPKKKIDWKKLNRITICISSQLWCPVGCVFCVTWKLWIVRSLAWHEIVSQILFANDFVAKKFGKREDGTLRKVRNVVFMGMWEPLLNYENTKKVLPFLLDQTKLSLSKRHITISTVWIIPGIKKLIEDGIDVKLAVSLHAPNQKLREELIPFAKIYKLDDLLAVLDEYVEATNNRIFYEYVMIKDITDTDDLAKELGALLQWKLVHVNLIPYNRNPATDFEESSVSQMKRFKFLLEKRAITVTIRDSMGRDVKSACGQLWYEEVVNK